MTNQLQHFEVGQSVKFGQHGQPKSRGVIVKVNRKNIKIQAVDAHKNQPAGTQWNVSRGLVTVVDEDYTDLMKSERDMAIHRIRLMLLEYDISPDEL